MNTTQGWVKIHRKIIEKAYFKKSEYIHLWLTLLLKANHEEREFFWNGKIEKLLPGQLITGRDALSQETGIHRSTIERILKFFESEQQIEQQTTNKFRLITIKNWEDYQKIEQPIEQVLSTVGATVEQPVSTNKKVKNDKNEKKDKIVEFENHKEENKVLDIFYQINPTLNYASRTQRLAVKRMYQKLGQEKTTKMAVYAVSIYGQEFAPTITTPVELERNLSKLGAYWIKHNKKTIINLDNL